MTDAQPREQAAGVLSPTRNLGIEAAERERRGYLLFGAWTGTTLAGGVFGVLLFLWEIVLDSFSLATFSTFSDLFAGACQLILGCFAGFIIGSILAGTIATFVVIGTFGILAALGIRRMPIWVASCIGGWTAFWCCGGFLWVPILLGQVGAAWVAHRTIDTDRYRILTSVQPPPTNRFGLGQLFRFMTVACVVLGIVSLLPLEQQVRLEMGYCLAWQLVSVPVALAALRTYAERST